MSNPDIIKLYSTSQAGGELPYFVGKQFGTGWLQTIGRFALPILRRIGAIGMKTAHDVINNKANILPSLKTNAMTELKDFMASPEVTKIMSKDNTTNESKLKGAGIKRKHSSINKQMNGYGTIFEK